MKTFLHGFAEKCVERPGECWPWIAGTGSQRRGRMFFPVHGKMQMEAAHRVSYQLFVGEIPADHHIHHKCHNPNCVNPAHLEPIPKGEHIEKEHPEIRQKALATIARKRLEERCIHGHLWAENALFDKRGFRQCKLCRKRIAAKWWKTKGGLK